MTSSAVFMVVESQVGDKSRSTDKKRVLSASSRAFRALGEVVSVFSQGIVNFVFVAIRREGNV